MAQFSLRPLVEDVIDRVAHVRVRQRLADTIFTPPGTARKRVRPSRPPITQRVDPADEFPKLRVFGPRPSAPPHDGDHAAASAGLEPALERLEFSLPWRRPAAEGSRCAQPLVSRQWGRRCAPPENAVVDIEHPPSEPPWALAERPGNRSLSSAGMEPRCFFQAPVDPSGSVVDCLAVGCISAQSVSMSHRIGQSPRTNPRAHLLERELPCRPAPSVRRNGPTAGSLATHLGDPQPGWSARCARAASPSRPAIPSPEH